MTCCKTFIITVLMVTFLCATTAFAQTAYNPTEEWRTITIQLSTSDQNYLNSYIIEKYGNDDFIAQPCV